jgi:hypothetical protein
VRKAVHFKKSHIKYHLYFYFLFFIFSWWEENFLKKAFFPPHPHLSKTLQLGAYFFAIISALDGRTHNVRTAHIL